MAKSVDYIQFRKVDDNFRIGNAISDKELVMLLKVYTILSDNLVLLGDLHRLSWREVHNQKLRLEDMKKQRKKK